MFDISFFEPYLFWEQVCRIDIFDVINNRLSLRLPVSRLPWCSTLLAIDIKNIIIYHFLIEYILKYIRNSMLFELKSV